MDCHDQPVKSLHLQPQKHCQWLLQIDLFKQWQMSVYITYCTYIFCILNILNYFVQDGFNPGDINFNTFPTMAKHIVDEMLPNEQGQIHHISLHEGAY